MDLWFKQEVDALSRKLLEAEAQNKRQHRKIHLLEMHRHQASIVIRELQQESAFRQVMIHEIFDNHPEVHAEYTAPFIAEEEVDPEETESETEWEEDELERGESS
jgi:hypothetical protein